MITFDDKPDVDPITRDFPNHFIYNLMHCMVKGADRRANYTDWSTSGVFTKTESGYSINQTKYDQLFGNLYPFHELQRDVLSVDSNASFVPSFVNASTSANIEQIFSNSMAQKALWEIHHDFISVLTTGVHPKTHMLEQACGIRSATPVRDEAPPVLSMQDYLDYNDSTPGPGEGGPPEHRSSDL